MIATELAAVEPVATTEAVASTSIRRMRPKVTGSAHQRDGAGVRRSWRGRCSWSCGQPATRLSPATSSTNLHQLHLSRPDRARLFRRCQTVLMRFAISIICPSTEENPVNLLKKS
jgi:hypothetical protein